MRFDLGCLTECKGVYAYRDTSLLIETHTYRDTYI